MRIVEQNNIQNSKNPDESHGCNPMACVDFTCEWNDNESFYQQFSEDSSGLTFTVPPATKIKTDTIFTRLSLLERSEFCYLLDKELERTACFFSSHLVKLSTSLENFKTKFVENDNRSTSGEKNNETTNEACMVDIGGELIELLAFFVTNMITLRQILIRYDAYARTVRGLKLSDWFFHSRNHVISSGCSLQDIFQIEFLLSLEVSYVLYIQELQIEHMRDQSTKGIHYSVSYLKEFSSEFDKFKALLEKSQERLFKTESGNLNFKDRCRRYFLLGSVSKNLNMEPRFLHYKGRSLKNELEAISIWRKTKELKSGTSSGTNEYSTIAPENVLPLILNLLACFLYMMNNYIVEPSSAYYAQALGASDAMSGLLVGAMPMANMVAAVCYSVWTNHSYRQPLLFAGTLMVIGNIMYSCAYNYRSIGLCIFGRAVTGLGGPRLINRRYVADATPFSLRTAASAAFAAMTALGAACGPAAAIGVDFFNVERASPFGIIYFNGMTGPGYLMAFLWLIYLVIIVYAFTEPNRTGLEELQRRENGDIEKQEDEQRPENLQIISLESCLSMDFDERLKENTEDYLSIIEKYTGAFFCFKHITEAVKLCMTLAFVKRITLECVMGSTSVLTKHRYGWSVKNVGSLHFVNGLLVIPLAILSGWFSQFVEDRRMIFWCILMASIGMFTLIDFSDLVSMDNDAFNEDSSFSVGPRQYIAGYMIAFLSIEACESMVVSTLSKVVPSALASGTFNSGLLATLVGTGGRSMGDAIITIMGLISIRNLQNLLFVPSFILQLLMLYLVW
eukprot:CAMPEP_0178971626 /NCGR_PEP_ID=MMETSP0789-20121207/20421_1 /TAXON_ID=3005 /ORGANISM="Rhizosolenia setigera, Strain CCMP 1694" /LENGTH=790 /DNA_ID=CAMNT_0020658701 /DNA_START=197 /DNA_END=2566 /DNA_ORIENTATION=+